MLVTTGGRERNSLFPDVPTSKELGFSVNLGSSRGLAMSAGTPKEIVEVFSGAVKRACMNAEVKQKIERIGLEVQYMSTEDYAKYWVEMENITRKLLEQEGIKVPKS